MEAIVKEVIEKFAEVGMKISEEEARNMILHSYANAMSLGAASVVMKKKILHAACVGLAIGTGYAVYRIVKNKAKTE